MKETLKPALEALEVYRCKAEHHRTKEDESEAVEAIIALKAALAQSTWIGLTDEEITKIFQRNGTPNGFARAIEKALKEKNT